MWLGFGLLAGLVIVLGTIEILLTHFGEKAFDAAIEWEKQKLEKQRWYKKTTKVVLVISMIALSVMFLYVIWEVNQ